MGTNGRPSIGKRQKELARQEKQRDKATQRAQRAVERQNRPEGVPGEDPDIAGQIPGPQPPLED